MSRKNFERLLKSDVKIFERLIKSDVPQVKLGNEKKSGKCGMCGFKFTNLYPQKVGQVNFYICENCKSVMDM